MSTSIFFAILTRRANFSVLLKVIYSIGKNLLHGEQLFSYRFCLRIRIVKNRYNIIALPQCVHININLMNVKVMYSRMSGPACAAAVVARSLCLFLCGAFCSDKVVFFFQEGFRPFLAASQAGLDTRSPKFPFQLGASPIRIKVCTNTDNNLRLSIAVEQSADRNRLL